MQPMTYVIRPAEPPDVPSLMRMKLQLAVAEEAEDAVRATEQDWLRCAFGPNARFIAFIAEHEGTPVGMITCSERYYTGWPQPAIYVGDIYVEPRYRRCGIARAMLSRVAEYAIACASPMIELTVRDSNSARHLYHHCGFQRVDDCVSYVAAGSALAELAGETKLRLASEGPRLASANRGRGA
jgi:ribosomal protein S18 acetylase RimI-like enzyme